MSVSDQPDRVRFIEHRGLRLLYHDFSGVHDPSDAFARIALAREKAQAEPPRSIRALVDVRGSHFNTAVTRALRELAAHNTPLVLASAIVGATRLQRIIVTAVYRFAGRTFSTFDEPGPAKDWLVEQK
jgi:hypothetical protein